MTDQVICALSDLFARWFAYQKQRGIRVRCPAEENRLSPCRSDAEYTDGWKPWIRPQATDLHNIASALDCEFHPAIHAYYGHGFAGSITASFKGLKVELVQPWNEEDFERLQQNLVAHVLMLRRLKLPVTLFLATVSDETKLISLDNETGEVILEQLGKTTRWKLADSLPEFLSRLSPLLMKDTNSATPVNLPA
ncbi:MAG: SecY-interacting protein [Tolumonas sp.]|nr:SecY-interacting protein [Tolumonas sp.]